MAGVTTQPAAAAATRYPCDSCGALQVYKPGSGELVCAYCGHHSRIAEARTEIVETDLEAAIAEGLANAAAESIATVKCDACAAEFTLRPNEHAGSCPFCGHAVVAGTGTSRRIKPAALLPFAIDEAEARKRLRQWIGGLWLAPSKLRDFARHPGRLTGMYLPYWTFDSHTTTDYVGQRGTIHHERVRTRVMRNGRPAMVQRTVQRVRWSPARGRVEREFDDVLVPAAQALPESIEGRLRLWDLQDLRPYTEDYLAGFRSEAYSIGLRDGFAAAQAVMRDLIQDDVRADIGGDLQRVDRMEVTHRQPSFKHVLLPVWLGAFTFRSRSFRVCVNGRTGEVAGDRPWSRVKIAGLIGLALLLAALLALLGEWGGLDPGSFGGLR